MESQHAPPDGAAWPTSWIGLAAVIASRRRSDLFTEKKIASSLWLLAMTDRIEHGQVVTLNLKP